MTADGTIKPAPAVDRNEQVDEDVRALLDSGGPSAPRLGSSSLAEIRDHFFTIRPPDRSIEVPVVTDATMAGVPVRIYRQAPLKAGESAPVLIWLHGGGWVLGNCDSAEVPARSLATAAGITVISVDYRLAPEHPFPAAFDDSVAVVRHVIDYADDLGVDPNRIVVGGDSAGANLAAAAANELGGTGTTLCGQLLVYPVVADDFATPSAREVGDVFGLSVPDLGWYWDQYVPNQADRIDPRVAVIHGDLATAPPAFVLTCGFDPLASEGAQYADALRSAGVDVKYENLPGAVHGVFALHLESGRRGRALAAQWLQQAVA